MMASLSDLVGDRHALHAVVAGHDGVLQSLAEQDRRLAAIEAASLHLEFAAIGFDQGLAGIASADRC